MANEIERREVDSVEPQHTYNATATYDNLDPRKEGYWAAFSEDGSVNGLIWTDRENGAGVYWVKQTPNALRIHEVFTMSKMMGLSALSAYGMVDTMVPTVSFEEINSGPLSGAVELANTLTRTEEG